MLDFENRLEMLQATSRRLNDVVRKKEHELLGAANMALSKYLEEVRRISASCSSFGANTQHASD